MLLDSFCILFALAAGAAGLIAGLTLWKKIRKKSQTEFRLQNSENKLRAMIDNALDAVISIDQKGVVTEWNKQAETIFGWTHDEAVGALLSDMIIPAEHRPAHVQGLKNFLTGGTGPILNRRIEIEALNRGGMRFPVELSVAVQKLHDKSYQFTAFVRDISERKAAEKKLKELYQFQEDIMNHMPDPIFMKDRQHRWIGGNKAFWEIMDGPPEKFIGHSDYEFFPKEEADIFWQKDDEVFNSGDVIVNEEFFTDSHGKQHTFSTKKKTFLNDKGEAYLIGVIRDITDIKETQERLLRYTAQIEAVNKDLEDFSYIASHDLKEPLRGIYNFSQFLLEDYQDVLDEEGRQRLFTLQKLSKRLQDLIDNLLQYSRVGREDVAFSATDLNESLGNTLELMEPAIREKHAEIMVKETLPTLVCDPVRVEEIFRNLITNALKYNDNERIIVEVGHMTTHPKTTGIPTLYIKDNGIGIPDIHLKTIFRMFKRLHAREAYGGGTGSGLTIVKKIVERHNGRIWAESDGVKGTTFYFTLSGSDKHDQAG